MGEDPSRRIWFGIEGGAIRYDGFRWQKFGIESSAMSFAQSGDVFFAATRSAIYRFKNDAFQQVFPLDDQRHWVIEDLTSSADGGLWAATNWGAVHLQGLRYTPSHADWKRITLLSTAEIVKQFQVEVDAEAIETVIVAETESRRWQSGAGICVLSSDPERNVVIAVAEDGPAARAGIKIGDRITSINGEQRNSVFQRELQGATGRTLQISAERAGETELIRTNIVFDQLDGSYRVFRPFRVAQHAAGTVWFASRLGHIYSASGDTGDQFRWTYHTRQHNLAPVGMPSIAVTDKGLVAVGRNTSNRAMLKYDGESWSAFELPRGIGSSILALNNGKILVGTNGAVLSVGPGGRVVDHAMQDYGIFGNDVILKMASDNALWILGEGSFALRVEPQDTWTSFEGLDYQDSGSDSVDWFISNQLSVVARENDQWRAYNASHGLMSAPLRVAVTKTGDVWAAGSHEGVAATARLEGDRWVRKLHPELSWGIDRRAVFEDRDGRMWFGAAVNQQVEEGNRGGVIRFDGQNWKHFRPTNRLDFVYGIAQTKDGSLWFAGPSLVQILPNDTFGEQADLPIAVQGFCDSVAHDEQGRLWVGTRANGLVLLTIRDSNGLRYAAEVYDESTQLSNNRIKSISVLSDNSVLVGTPAGFDRFDGESWARAPLPSMLAFGVDYSGMREGRDGDIWLNSVGLGHVSRDLAQGTGADLSGAVSKIRTYRFGRDSVAPETRIDARPTESMYGNEVVVGWSGSDHFNRTEPSDLVFSWRIGDQPWRPFSSNGQVSLQNLGVGEHRIQVRARDADFNVDATPAETTVVILPALWQRSWFRGLLLLTGVLMILGIVQTFRVFRSEASLQVSNQKLIAAEHELRNANSSLEKRVSLRTKELNDANQRLYESEVKYRSIVEDQSEYIVRFDADKKPTFMNEAFRRSLGAANGKTTLENPNDLLDRLEQVASNLAPSSSTQHITVRLESTEGMTRWEQWHCRALRDADGNLLGYQAIGTDITELREAEDRLNEKEKQLAHLARVSALGEMVAGISHEINQPLASISNFSAASLMTLDRESEDIEKSEKRENVREWIGRINEQANRINEIIKGLRRFGRPSTNRESFDIAQAVDEAMALCEAKIRAVVDDVELQLPPSLPKVYADRIQIEQVLVNLVRNACDAMDSTEITDRNLHIEGTTENEFVKIVVTDSGPGIPPEQIEEVFRAFTTTKSDGMGIGLAISRSIVESHGGTLRAIDFEGGCRFEFTLPTTAPQ